LLQVTEVKIVIGDCLGRQRHRARQGARPAETVVSGLKFPTGMTIGPDGAFYVSNQGFGFPAGPGEILRIKL
jgi:hypothetical protein